MKNYLAADTASKYLGAVLCYRGKKYEFFKDDCAMRHSSELMPAADVEIPAESEGVQGGEKMVSRVGGAEVR